MRFDGGRTLVLSRRNLEALIAKLDANEEFYANGGEPGSEPSACTIMGGSDADWIIVRAEENDVHYTDRPAGRMHSREEAQISKPETGTLEAYDIPVVIDVSLSPGTIVIRDHDPGDESGD